MSFQINSNPLLMTYPGKNGSEINASSTEKLSNSGVRRRLCFDGLDSSPPIDYQSVKVLSNDAASLKKAADLLTLSRQKQLLQESPAVKTPSATYRKFR